MAVVTEHVVLEHLEPFIEEQVIGLERVRKTATLSSMSLKSLQLGPRFKVVCATVIVILIIAVTVIPFILKQDCWRK